MADGEREEGECIERERERDMDIYCGMYVHTTDPSASLYTRAIGVTAGVLHSVFQKKIDGHIDSIHVCIGRRRDAVWK